MKRIFCDCCEQEIPTNNFNDIMRKPFQSDVPVDLANYIKVEVQIKVVPRASNGKHIDLCAACLWQAVDKVDMRPRQG